jgi:hypothetical protein
MLVRVLESAESGKNLKIVPAWMKLTFAARNLLSNACDLV